jgi:prolyl-tRNA synthetase
MKDLYSFHTTVEDLEIYYAQVLKVYKKIFTRLGLDAIQVEASGGSFSKYSHEFQVLTPNGEDEIIHCEKCDFAQNREINESKEGDVCPKCQAKLRVSAGSEVGNIFQLKTKYSTPFGLSYTDEKGEAREVQMGCYGIGISRLMGVIAEVFHNEKGLMWPDAVAPFRAHLIALTGQDENQNKIIMERATRVYETLQKQNSTVLFDDRENVSAGQKFAESDLMGIPWRLVISQKTGEQIEIKRRDEQEARLISLEEVIEILK